MGAETQLAKRGIMSILGPAASTALTGVAPWLKAAMGIWMVGDLVKGGYGLYSANKDVDRQTELAKMRLKAEQEQVSAEASANKESENKYLAMLADLNRKESESRSQDRQMQLLMAMVANQSQLQAGTMEGMNQMQGRGHPLAMATLLRNI